MKDILIRPLKKEDADAVNNIQLAIINNFENTEFKKQIQEQINNIQNISFVAEFNKKVVGYMISYTILSGFGINKSAWITMMGVDPQYMGQGIGKSLAEEILKVYKEKKIKEIYSLVRWDSTDLLSFFKALGFNRSNFINLYKKIG